MSLRSKYLLLVLCLSLSAQGQLLDSISILLQTKPRLALKLDGRGSFISNQPARMLGIKLGLDHGGRLQYGIGYNFLRSKFERETVVLEGGIERAVTTRLHMGMVTPWAEYAFYQRGPWQVSIPVQLGIGSGHLTYRDADDQKQKIDKTFLFVYEPAMTVQYRFWRYFGLSGGFGYRLVFKSKGSLGEQLTAPIYLFGLKVFFADIINDSQAAGEEPNN